MVIMPQPEALECAVEVRAQSGSSGRFWLHGSHGSQRSTWIIGNTSYGLDGRGGGKYTGLGGGGGGGGGVTGRGGGVWHAGLHEADVIYVTLPACGAATLSATWRTYLSLYLFIGLSWRVFFLHRFSSEISTYLLNSRWKLFNGGWDRSSMWESVSGSASGCWLRWWAESKSVRYESNVGLGAWQLLLCLLLL